MVVMFQSQDLRVVMLMSEPRKPQLGALNPCYSLGVTDQTSHPYRATGKIKVLYVLIFMFLERSQENRLWRYVLPNTLTSSAYIRSCNLSFNFSPSLFSWPFLRAYSKAKLKSNSDKASHFRPF
jgi:hypothetical protein